MSEPVWFVATERPGVRAEWDWASLGAPEVRELHPTRRPNSGDFSRHIPVTAYSATTGSHLELESGLEHDLLRRLDRDPTIDWLVAQPVLLCGVGGRRATHTPDLLSRADDGSVTLWDARPAERRDDIFTRKSDDTRAACREVGWSYEVFGGFASTAERLNEVWLAGYRRIWPWHPHRAEELRARFPASFAASEAYAVNDTSGQLVNTMWHLAWRHDLTVDLSRPLRGQTQFAWAADHG